MVKFPLERFIRAIVHTIHYDLVCLRHYSDSLIINIPTRVRSMDVPRTATWRCFFMHFTYFQWLYTCSTNGNGSLSHGDDQYKRSFRQVYLVYFGLIKLKHITLFIHRMKCKQYLLTTPTLITVCVSARIPYRLSSQLVTWCCYRWSTA